MSADKQDRRRSRGGIEDDLELTEQTARDVKGGMFPIDPVGRSPIPAGSWRLRRPSNQKRHYPSGVRPV
jgi:hypothetical protein